MGFSKTALISVFEPAAGYHSVKGSVGHGNIYIYLMLRCALNQVTFCQKACNMFLLFSFFFHDFEHPEVKFNQTLFLSIDVQSMLPVLHGTLAFTKSYPNKNRLSRGPKSKS